VELQLPQLRRRAQGDDPGRCPHPVFDRRQYRILRSKILKILDEKFFHPSEDVSKYEARISQITSAFKKIRDQDLLENLASPEKAPKIFNFSSYAPDMKSLKYPRIEKSHKPRKELETLKIENLCKYLTLDEIELVCEDPIYFLGREEYRINDELNDHKGWNRQLVLVKEKRRKERIEKKKFTTIT